jgi:hypothetical protein
MLGRRLHPSGLNTTEAGQHLFHFKALEAGVKVMIAQSIQNRRVSPTETLKFSV